MTERARMGGQYGVDPGDRQGAGDSSGGSATDIVTSSSATPTAALDVDRPTSLSLPLTLRALTLPSPAFFDQRVIDVPSIRSSEVFNPHYS
jgi:hypothetical protein